MGAILRRLRAGSVAFLLVAAVAAAMSFGVGAGPRRTLLLSAAVALATIFGTVQAIALIQRVLARRRFGIIVSFLEHDGAPGFCTDADGSIFAQNPAATERFGARDGATMARTLEALFANPDAVVHRLRSTLGDQGSTREDVVTRRGHVRVALHRIPGGFLWRLEDLVDRPPRASDGIGLPVLTFGSSGTILFMNEVLRAAVGRRVKRLRDLFEDIPLQNGGLNRLMTKDGSETVRVVLSEPVNGRQEAFVMPAGDVMDGRVDLDALPVALLRLDGDGCVVFANRLARELLPGSAGGGETRLAAMVEGLGRSVREWVSEAASGRGLYRPEVVRVTGAEVDTYLQITLGRPLSDGDGGLLAVLNDATELKTMEAQFVQSQKMQAIGQLAGGVAHDFNNLLTAISGHCDLLLLRHGEGDDDYADLTQITQNANRAAALVGQLLAFSRKQTLEMQRIDLRDALSDLAHLLNRLVGERVRLTLDHDPALIPIRGDRRQLEQVLMNLVVNARDAMPGGGEIRIQTRCHYLEAPILRDRVTMPVGQYVVIEVTDEGQGISPDNLSRIFEPFFTTKRPGEGTGLGLSMAYGIVKQSGGYIFADSTVGKGTRFSLFFPAMAESVSITPSAPMEIDEGMAESSERSGNGAADHSGAFFPQRRAGRPGDADAARAGAEVDMAEPDDGDGEVLTTLVKSTLASDGASSSGPERPSAAATSGEGSEQKSRAEGPKPVVLLVEDEAPVRAFASRALRLRGYEVVEAESAESALDQLADGTLCVDLFVTDVMMPGLDGPTWVREALKTRPDVRTVFISGYTQDALSETSIPVPNAVFLPKPFSLNDLTRTVEKALL